MPNKGTPLDPYILEQFSIVPSPPMAISKSELETISSTLNNLLSFCFLGPEGFYHEIPLGLRKKESLLFVLRYQ